MKKWLLPLLLVIIAVAVAVVLLKEPKTNNQTAQEEVETFDPQNPNFILGQVVSVSGNSMEIKSSGETYTVAIGSETKLLKQVMVEEVLTPVDATVADFKANTTVVVYYSEGSGSEKVSANATPSKIQIIAQP